MRRDVSADTEDSRSAIALSCSECKRRKVCSSLLMLGVGELIRLSRTQIKCVRFPLEAAYNYVVGASTDTFQRYSGSKTTMFFMYSYVLSAPRSV